MSKKDGRDQVYVPSEGKWKNNSVNSQRYQNQQKRNETAKFMNSKKGKEWKKGLIERGEWQNFSEGGGGGCFITTAVCKTQGKTDDCAELMSFRHFRDTFMQKTSEMSAEVEEYYEIAPKICARIDSGGAEIAAEKYAQIWGNYLKHAFVALETGELQKTYIIYKDMVLHLKKEYL